MVEVDAMHRTARLAILKHTLCTVAKRNDAQSVASDGCRVGQIVHLWVGHVGVSHIASHPRVEDAGAVDAQQHAQTWRLGSVVDMGKRVDARQGVMIHLAQHAIDNARCAGCRGYLARVEHIERQGVVGLVTCTVGDGCALGQSRLGCRLGTDDALHPKGGLDCCHQAGVDAVVVEQGL